MSGPRIALLWLGLAAGLAGCRQEGFGVDLTLRFDDSIGDEALARVTTMSIVSSGDETAIYTLPFGRAAERQERLVFRPLMTTRTLTLSVSALAVDPLAESAEVIAEGKGDPLSLAPGIETPLELVLFGQAGADASFVEDLAAADDLAGGEAGVPSDLGVSGDAAMPPDLGLSGSKCAAAGFPICESFEAGIAPLWTQHMTNGLLTLDTARAYRGNTSLKMHANATAAGVSADVRLSEKDSFTVAPADLYVRAFFWVPTQPVNSVQLMSTVQNVSPYLGEQLLESSQAGLFALGDSISGGAYDRSATTSAPTDRWFCLEWHVHVGDAVTGLMQVWLDGTEVADLHDVEPTDPPNHLGTLSVGYQFFSPANANPASDAWVDEIAVNSARIGCDK